MHIIDGFEQLNHISTRFKVIPIYRVGEALNITCSGGSGDNNSLMEGGGGIKLVHKS